MSLLFSLITVRYTAPVENIFWKRDAMKPIGQKIVKLLYDMNFDANPIILHVFSNGGAYLYQHIDLAIKEFQTPLDVSFPTLSIDFTLNTSTNRNSLTECFRFVALYLIHRQVIDAYCLCIARYHRFMAKIDDAAA